MQTLLKMAGGAGRNRTADRGFADLGLTTWLPRRYTKNPRRRARETILERETGFEPATSTLARSHSTTELLPLASLDYSECVNTRANAGARFELSLNA